MPIYSGFSHEKWWFSIAMLVHQRVIIAGFWMFLVMFGAAPYLFVWKKNTNSVEKYVESQRMFWLLNCKIKVTLWWTNIAMENHHL